MENKQIFKKSTLYTICNKHKLLTNINKQQLNNILNLNKYKTLTQLAAAIYVCSNKEYNEIYKILANEIIKNIKNKKA